MPIACLIAATAVMPVFACFHAVDPWDYYGFEPVIPSLSAKGNILASLKTDEWFHIDVTNRDGLITFPSFHVLLALLAAAALWPVRYLRWPVVVWASLIVISTVTTGIHYSVDVFGGLAMAVVAHLIARTYIRWESATGRSKLVTS